MPQMATSGHRRRSKRGSHLVLIALRIDQGLSRDALAVKADIGRETVRLAESGFVPTPRIQFAIAKAVGTTPLALWPIEAQRKPKRSAR